MKYLHLFFAIAIIAAISWLSLKYWQEQYPLSMEFYDIAYHNASAVGLQRCGGFTLNNFWAAYSIEGTPNIYFPFYHIAGLLMLSAGTSAYFLTYWLSWMFLPLSFLAVLLFVYNVYGSRSALYSVMFLGLSPVWIEKMWGASPQALVYVLTPLIFLALAKERYITVFLLTICAMATHFTGLFLLPFLFIYALQNKKHRKAVFILLGALLLISFPLVLFGIQRIKAIHLSVGFSRGTLIDSIKWSFHRIFDVRGQFHVFLGWLAVAGLAVSYLKRKQFLILPSYFFAILPMAWTGQEIKFWGVPSLFIFSLLGGVAMGCLHDYFSNRSKNKIFSLARTIKNAVIGLLFFIFIFLTSHWLFYHVSNWPVQVKTPTLNYLRNPGIWLRPKLTFSMTDREQITKLVKENVKDDEFFWIESSNNINNQVALNSMRSTVASVTLQKNAMTLVKGIKLVVAKVAPSGDYILLDSINNGFNVYILRDPSKAAKVNIPEAILKIRQLRMIFMILGILILIDLFNLPKLAFRKIKSKN
ncbi:MAG: hypothetical protein Q7O04_06495 [Candidatus Omnitrophota bacterium]|nr:hypothetical protein [Candidatus Omnitrophota bacterium]